MRYGNYGNTDLEGFVTCRDWLINAIDTALVLAPDNTAIVFIVPNTNLRYTIADRDNLERFRKKVLKCVGLSVGVTRNAIRSFR